MTGVAPHRTHRGRNITLIVVGSVVGVLALGLGAVLTVGGILVPALYLDPWKADYHQQFDDPRMQVVAHAVLAPSGHNMQPWIVELDPTDPDVLTLFVDADRLTSAVDPLARQTLVSQGTFLAYLEVAAAELGYRTTVELFPDGEYDESDLAASMTRMPVALSPRARRPRPTTTRRCSSRTQTALLTGPTGCRPRTSRRSRDSARRRRACAS